MAYASYREIEDWEPRLKIKNVYGFAGRHSGRGAVTTIWNPYKHRIIMETHYRFPKGFDFLYFEDSVPFYCLYLYGDSIINSVGQLANIGKTLLHLNPHLDYVEFCSLMYELVHPSYPYFNHSEIKFSQQSYDKFLNSIFSQREVPKPVRYKKFFFNPAVQWYENEIMEIVRQVASPMFGAEEGMDQIIREIAEEKGIVKNQDLADMYSCSTTTIRKILRTNPHLRKILRDINAEYRAHVKRQKEEIRIMQERNKEKAKRKEARRAMKVVVRPIPGFYTIIKDFWNENHRIIKRTQMRVRLREKEIRVRKLDFEYHYLKGIEQLKRNKRVRNYLENVLGEKVD